VCTCEAPREKKSHSLAITCAFTWYASGVNTFNKYCSNVDKSCTCTVSVAVHVAAGVAVSDAVGVAVRINTAVMCISHVCCSVCYSGCCSVYESSHTYE